MSYFYPGVKQVLNALRKRWYIASGVLFISNAFIGPSCANAKSLQNHLIGCWQQQKGMDGTIERGYRFCFNKSNIVEVGWTEISSRKIDGKKLLYGRSEGWRWKFKQKYIYIFEFPSDMVHPRNYKPIVCLLKKKFSSKQFVLEKCKSGSYGADVAGIWKKFEL